MDLISHSLLGAATGFTAFSARLGRKALLLSAAGGMVPDIDFFLRPFADPALPGEMHRHFTHSFVFVPLGGLIALAPFLFSKSIRSQWQLAWAATSLACLTHVLLDAATSYGTLLLWPFSWQRISWDIVAVIDPLFTLTLLSGVVIAAISAARRPAAIALCLAVLYLSLGFVQNQRGLAAQQELAESRGHANFRGRAMPLIGNLILWRSVYEHDGRIYCDGIRLPVFARAAVHEGDSLPKFTANDLPQGVPARVTDIVNRFTRFADGYVAAVSDRPTVLGDLRYSPTLAGTQPLWGLTLAEGNPHPEHMTAQWSTFFEARREGLAKLWGSIWSEEEFLRDEISAHSARSALPAPATARD